jgi:phosphoribosylformylglycinamidine cyclo-ligase
VILGIASSGPHSNGYSLVRKVVEVSGAKLDQDFHGRPLGEVLLTPTRIYVKPLLDLFTKVSVHALAHITGGGLPENLPRVLPKDCRAVIDSSAWQRPAIFDWLQQQGNIADSEMYRTFNCGIGMALVVPAAEAETAMAELRASGEEVSQIGIIEPYSDGEQVVIN